MHSDVAFKVMIKRTEEALRTSKALIEETARLLNESHQIVSQKLYSPWEPRNNQETINSLPEI